MVLSLLFLSGSIRVNLWIFFASFFCEGDEKSPLIEFIERHKVNPILKAEKLSRWYGPVIGINDIDWEFQGGIVGLLGPNGAGKSTFLKIVTGQLRPSKGTITVLDESPFGKSHLFQKVGFSPEQDIQYTYLSALQFLSLVAELHGFTKKEALERSEKVLERVSLEKAKNRPMHTYSKGMRQRVKIAQALIHHPTLLILDEPLNGMDPVGRKVLLDFFREFTEDGNHHILLSSHVLHEIETLTNEFVLINKGRIRAQGNLQEIRSLMDEFPHRIRIKSHDPRTLASKLLLQPYVKGISLTSDNTLLVQAPDPEQFYTNISSLIVETKAEVEEIFSEDDNLESVFRYLVGKA